MILQFTTENFKSFFSQATLNLVAAKSSPKKTPTRLDFSFGFYAEICSIIAQRFSGWRQN
jgi:hypothetical protein